METSVVRGVVLATDRTDVALNLRRGLRSLADRAWMRVVRHGERISGDSDYREAVEHLMALLPALPGRLGRAGRVVVAGHDVLLKAVR